jgi:hypothetical protein
MYKNYNLESLKGRKCEYCDKPLRVIGLLRMNGDVNILDWSKRKLHKSCYKKIV